MPLKTSCYDCGLAYDSPGWADVVIPDIIWRLISPTGDEGGLLCFHCMVARLAELDLRNVPYSITSGPFAFSVGEPLEDTVALSMAAIEVGETRPIQSVIDSLKQKED